MSLWRQNYRSTQIADGKLKRLSWEYTIKKIWFTASHSSLFLFKAYWLNARWGRRQIWKPVKLAVFIINWLGLSFWFKGMQRAHTFFFCHSDIFQFLWILHINLEATWHSLNSLNRSGGLDSWLAFISITLSANNSTLHSLLKSIILGSIQRELHVACVWWFTQDK